MPSGPPAHRLVAGTFPALEPAFLEAVRELKRADPLAPVEVLVGSNLVALYLRRRAAEELGAVANLRFLTFLDLARAIVPDDDPRPPLPALGEAFLARRALQTTKEAAPFGAIRGRPGFAAALVWTANDLRDAGIGLDEIRRLVPAASDLPDRRRHLEALAAVLVAFEESRRRFKDATSLLERAASAAVPPSPGPLLVYGLYDLGGIRARLLANVSRARPVHAFVPEDGAEEPPGPAPVRSALFFDLLGVEPNRLPSLPARAPAVTIAPSDNAESREVVREILVAVDAGTPLHRIAVFVRNPEAQEPALVAELTLRKIPYFRPAGSGFASSPVGRAARLVAVLAVRGFHADAFRELLDLLETLGRFPAMGLGETTPARLGTALAGLGVAGGFDAVETALGQSLARLSRPFPAPDDPEGWFAGRRAAQRRELEFLGTALAAVRSKLPPADPAPWAEWAGRLRRSVDALLGPVPERERLERGFEAIEGLERVETRASVDAGAVEELLEEAINLSPRIRGRFERDGVSLLSAVSARGLLFDVVLVPGLIEQSFPRPSRPDPLLFDAERRRIAEAARKPLVPRTGDRHGREERFLFSLARASARKRLVLLAAAREIATDRPRLLSPFLLDLLPEEARRPLLDRELGRDAAALPANVVWLPAGRLPREGPPLDADEALRRHLAAEPGARKTLPAGAASLERALRRGESRARATFTEYEGRIGRSVARLALRNATVSASRLERFSQCAYRSFLERGLGLEALPDAEPDGIFALDALERGNALHAALRDVTRRLVAEKRDFSGLGGSEIAGIASRAAEAAVAAAIASRRAAPPPLLVEIEEERLRSLLLGLLIHLAGESRELPTAGAEIRFGPQTLDPADRDEDAVASTDTPARVPGLPFDTRLLGRIDRLDLSGDRALVVDYKTGPPAPYGKTNSKERLVAAGERLQLPAYALAAGLFGAKSVASEYLFVEESAGEDARVTPVRFDEERTAAAIEALRAVLVLVDEAVSRGLFLPKTTSLRSKDPCGYCDFAAICGPGHARLYERKWAGEAREGTPNPLLALRGVP